MNDICIFDVNIWNFETCYFQGCLSPCMKISENLKHTIFRTVCLSVRSCGEAAPVPRPGEPHLLNCRCLQVTSISFTLLLFILTDFHYMFPFPFPLLCSSILLHYCWGWGFFVPFASQLLLCSLSFPWLHLGEKETFCSLGCSFNRVKGQFCQQETQLC